MIKIFMICADSSLSGAPKHILTLISNINKNTFQVTAICPKGWLSDELVNLNIKVINLEFKNFFDISTVRKLNKILLTRRPDIIHYHGIRAGFLVTLTSKNKNTKKIYSEHLFTCEYHLENKLYEKIQKKGLRYISKNADIIVTPSKAVKSFLNNNLGISKKKDFSNLQWTR